LAPRDLVDPGLLGETHDLVVKGLELGLVLEAGPIEAAQTMDVFNRSGREYKDWFVPSRDELGLVVHRPREALIFSFV
jgi:hypothetical protein